MNIKIRIIFLIITGISPLIAQNSTEFYRRLNANDSLLIIEKTSLISSELTNENGIEYYELAQALWRTRKNSLSEKMFREIEKSELGLFNQTKLYNSDIPEDTIQNKYGYGSFTFNYKNKASIYLTKILIEKKEFGKALNYLTLADIKYQVIFNDGTGSYMYLRAINKLYALCFEGLNQYKKVIELLLPSSLWHYNNNKILRRSLKEVYTFEERKVMKESAISSISYITNESEFGEYVQGFIIVFNTKLNLGSVYLKNIKISPTEYFIKSYKDSYLYKDVFKFGNILFND